VTIFDLDGTLLDSNGLWKDVDREFLGARGLTPSAEYERVIVGLIFPTAAVYTKEHYGLPESPEEIMAEWEALAARHYRELAPLKPGAAALLERYRAQERPMALFTACRPALCRLALERFGLARYFSHIVYAEELGIDKHDPRCFLRLSQLLGVRPGDCTLLDDSPHNCATAKAAGMAVIGVRDDFYGADAEAQLRAVCDRYIMSLEELLPTDE